MNAFGVKPSVVTFNALISVCGKAGKVEEAMRVFGAMNVFAVKPSVVTFTTFISDCGKAGNIEDALRVFREMTCMFLPMLNNVTVLPQSTIAAKVQVLYLYRGVIYYRNSSPLCNPV